MGIKKVIATAGISLLVVSSAGIGYYWYKIGLSERNATEVVSSLQAQRNVTQQFEFKPPTVKNKVELVEFDGNAKNVPLYLGNGEYYNVKIPADKKVVTDYATYIYAEDMSFQVSTVRAVLDNEIKKSFAISNAIKDGTNIIRTKDGVKAPQSLGIALTDTIGVVATCYDAPQVASTIYNGFKSSGIKQIKAQVLVDKNTKQYNSASEILLNQVTDSNSLLSSSKNAGAYMYSYEDGWLTEFNATRGFDDICEDFRNRAVVSEGNSHCDALLFTTRGGVNYYYGEFGSTTILCIGDTINHTYACIGVGSTARVNIVAYLRSVYK